MSSFNKVVLVGRLTADPEKRSTNSGTSVANFSIAVDRRPSNGETETDFFDIVTFSGLADTCANHLTKGRLVLVDGRLQTRKYENSQGQNVRVVEVIAEEVQFLDRPKEQ